MTRRLPWALVAVLLALTLGSCSDDDPGPSGPSDEALVAELFELLQAEDLDGLDDYLSPAFQLQRTDGSHVTKAEYLEDPATIDDYEILEASGTRFRNTRIVRSIVTSASTIEGKRTTQDPAPRLSTFTWNGDRWQLAAHANYVAFEDGDGDEPDDVGDLELASRLFELLKQGDREALADFLHPALQLGRSDGSSLTREEYLANPASVDAYENVSVEGTSDGDVRVIRSTFRTTARIDGRPLTTDPIPFLSTFVWSDGAWRLLSHANFGPLPR